MLDNRIFTFLTLCEVMNYRKTANILLMTQPAVTQHIQFLEREYETKFFEYSGKTLYKTDAGVKFEQYARSIVHNEKLFKSQIISNDITKISIGATKTIGNYAIDDMFIYLLQNDNYEIELLIDNSKRLLKKLNNFELDFVMLEGYFDKHNYDYRLIRNEELIGICSKNHLFANKEVEVDEIFKEHIILRENGSGTRTVLEHFLKEHNFSYDNFKNKSTISSLKMIEFAVINKNSISFVYDSIPKRNEDLATFRIKNEKIHHEFNCVYLKNSSNAEFINNLIEKV